MRVWFCGVAALVLAACDQGTSVPSETVSWTGSIGRLVLDGKRLDEVTFERRAGAEQGDGEMSVIAVDDAAFAQALRLETLRQPPAMESLEASLGTNADIDAGSSCWFHVEARATQPQVETSLGRLAIGFQQGGQRPRSIFSHRIYIEPTWQSFDIPFQVRSDIEAGGAEVVLGVGTQLQVIEVGAMSMRCFDESMPLDRLPATTFTYPGREDNAAWRDIAEGRIERYRKGDLDIQVAGPDGDPVADAEIHVQMTRHAFSFGAAVDAELLAGAGPGGGPSQYDDEATTRYRQTLSDLFNTVTFENDLNWAAWTDSAQRRVTEDALAWVDSLNLDLRGSRLISADWSDVPRDLKDKQNEPETIRAAVRNRVTTTVSELNGQVSAWNVVDSPRRHHELMDLLGWEEMEEWFRLARAAAVEPKLLLSENEVLAGDRLAELAAMLDGLIGKKVPIDAIGIQGHFGVQPPPIQVLSDRLDQLASFDLPLVITEFDMDTTDEQAQADFTRDLLTLAFSHPSVEGFMFWGFWEGRQASPDAAMYRQDWMIKPNGDAYRKLVLGDWWTDLVALSNAEGQLVSRVFQGDYMISARKDDLVATSVLTIGAEGARVELRLSEKGDVDKAL